MNVINHSKHFLCPFVYSESDFKTGMIFTLHYHEVRVFFQIRMFPKDSFQGKNKQTETLQQNCISFKEVLWKSFWWIKKVSNSTFLLRNKIDMSWKHDNIVLVNWGCGLIGIFPPHKTCPST